MAHDQTATRLCRRITPRRASRVMADSLSTPKRRQAPIAAGTTRGKHRDAVVAHSARRGVPIERSLGARLRQGTARVGRQQSWAWVTGWACGVVARESTGAQRSAAGDDDRRHRGAPGRGAGRAAPKAGRRGVAWDRRCGSSPPKRTRCSRQARPMWSIVLPISCSPRRASACAPGWPQPSRGACVRRW